MVEKLAITSDKSEGSVCRQRLFGQHAVFAKQINEVREDVPRRSREKIGCYFGIELTRDHLCSGGSRLQRGKDLPLARLAMGDQVLHALLRVGDRVAVPGKEESPIGSVQPGEALHILSHVPVRWRDHRGAPSHHVIAGKARLSG